MTSLERGRGRRNWARKRVVDGCGFGFERLHIGSARGIKIGGHPSSTRLLFEDTDGRIQGWRAGAPFFVGVIFIDDGCVAGGFSSFLLFVGFFVSLLCAEGGAEGGVKVPWSGKVKLRTGRGIEEGSKGRLRPKILRARSIPIVAAMLSSSSSNQST